MVNDVRGLFQKINQVDLPYQVFDDVEDDAVVPESHSTVLAPLPTPVAVDEPGDVFIEEVEVSGAGPMHGARAAIAAVRQRVFQGFSQPVAEAPAPEEAVVHVQVKAAPAVQAEARPAAIISPKQTAVVASAQVASRGLLRKYAPETQASAVAADGQTHLGALFAKLADKG